MNIGELKERIKNMSDDLPIVVSIGGSEHPLAQTYFNPNRFILEVFENDDVPPVEVPPIYTIQVQQADLSKFNAEDFKKRAMKEGIKNRIGLIKEFRSLTGSGLLEAKLYVDKIFGI